MLEFRLKSTTSPPLSARRRSSVALAGARLEQRTRVRLGQHRQPRGEPTDRAVLVGRQRAEVLAHVLGASRRGPPARDGEALGRHQLDDAGERQRLAGRGLLRDLDRELQIALGGATVVRLGEALGAEQLVLELGRVSGGQRVPVAGAVGRPLDEGRERPPRRPLAARPRTPGLPLRSIATTGRPRPIWSRQQRQQCRRLAGAGRAEDQTVSGERPLGDLDGPPGAVAADHDRRTVGGAGGDLGVTCPHVPDRSPARACHQRRRASARSRHPAASPSAR